MLAVRSETAPRQQVLAYRFGQGKHDFASRYFHGCILHGYRFAATFLYLENR